MIDLSMIDFYRAQESLDRNNYSTVVKDGVEYYLDFGGATKENTSVDIVGNELIIESNTDFFGVKRHVFLIGSKLTDVKVVVKDGVVIVRPTIKSNDVSITIE